MYLLNSEDLKCMDIKVVSYKVFAMLKLSKMESDN